MRYLAMLSDMPRHDSFVDHAASQLLQACDSSKLKNKSSFAYQLPLLLNPGDHGQL